MASNVSSNVVLPRVRAHPPFSAEEYKTILLGIRVFATGPLSIVGLISNMVNIAVFHRQGIKESSAIVTLTFLAISDLLCCFFTMVGSIFSLLHVLIHLRCSWKIQEQAFDSFLITRPLQMFTQITCCVTLYAAFERVISVIFPFKVKVIFNVRRTLVVLCMLCVLSFIVNIPKMFEGVPGSQYDRKLKEMLLTYVPSAMSKAAVRVGLIAKNLIILLCLVLVIVCNILTAWKVKMSQKFRSSYSATNGNKGQFMSTKTEIVSESKSQFEGNGCVESNLENSNSTGSKEVRLVKVIAVISAMFVLCYIWQVPYVIMFLYVYEYAYDYHGYISNIAFYVFGFIRTLNASINFVVYYKMSSRYKKTLEDMFTLRGMKK